MRDYKFINNCDLRHNVRRLRPDQQSRYNRRINNLRDYFEDAGAGVAEVIHCSPNMMGDARVRVDGTSYDVCFSLKDNRERVTDIVLSRLNE
jgi:hypothetical protein